MNGKVNWLNYEFNICKHGDAWNDVAGVYIFCGLNSKNQWQPFYIGQADSFKNRIPSHEKWNEAVKLGATHVHAMSVPQATTRDKIEKELIQTWKPPLNTHHA